MRFLLLFLAFSPLALGQHHGHHHGGPKPSTTQGVTSIDVYVDAGKLHLLTGEQEGEATVLSYRRSADGGASWTSAVRLPGPGPRPVRRGDDAQIAARGDTLLAVWSVPGTGWGGSGPLAGAVSSDGGMTWTAAGTPSDSGLTTGHGFVDLHAGAGGFHAVWLDGRDKAQGLRYARSVDGKKWSANETIAAKTCECCWNTLFEQHGALHVLYRAGNPRDMELAVLEKDAWRKKGAVASFGWHVKGCPETGGALAATADGTVHALAWTGKEGHLGLHVVSQHAAGWTAPRRLGTSDAQHGDLAANGRTLAAAWDEAGSVLASVSPDGRQWSAPRVLAAGTNALNPRIVAAGTGFMVFWTEAGADGGRVLRSEPLQ
jgi:hypothetical protein